MSSGTSSKGTSLPRASLLLLEKVNSSPLPASPKGGITLNKAAITSAFTPTIFNVRTPPWGGKADTRETDIQFDNGESRCG